MLLQSIKTHNDRYINAKNGREKQIIIWDMIDNLKIYSVFLKHPAFSEEHEFRMVIGIRTHSHDSICEFEVQNGIFVPHIEHEMPDPQEGSIIKSVTISPTCDKELAVYSLRKLANATNHYSLPIYTSDIPLRTVANS